jgi:transposase
MSPRRKYPNELMERGVRLALESGRPVAQIARDLGTSHPETLRRRVRQAQADAGERAGMLTTQEREEIRRLRKENYEPRRANEILESASLFFARELDPDRPK